MHHRRAAPRRLGPARILFKVERNKAQPLQRRLAGQMGADGRAHLVGAGRAAQGAAHGTTRIQKLQDNMLGDEASCSGDENGFGHCGSCLDRVQIGLVLTVARSVLQRPPKRPDLAALCIPRRTTERADLPPYSTSRRRDHLRLNLRCPLEDVQDTGITQDPADRIFQRKAVAAVDLQRVVRRRPGHPRAQQLGHPGLEVAAFPVILGPG